MKILTILFGKQKPIVINPLTKEEKELVEMINEYYERQKKKKKKISELFGKFI